ncbi:hypothetical protein N4G70_16735 [Streptomyces sp. ASQP_92]|uniref:hypothetical protein n=1 Tax=Streptomyces sp. ASQP_92 TaxID=2979116 RepID=UPI0021BFB2CB|nr:hypothetical protein [Streptomyces sp. ASQP_92]MCT9090498.1 hypothetical protein [Streptomyces sp. ASQP_92]
MSALPDNWDRDNQGNPKKRASWGSRLDVDQVAYLTAVHEAAHVLVGWQHGMRVRRVWSREVPAEVGRSWTGCVSWDLSDTTLLGYATMCAAGERAAARYVKELGVWEPEDIELVRADHDRLSAVEGCGRSGFHIAVDGPVPKGAWGMRWSQVIEYADVDVDAQWADITTLTRALMQREDMTGPDVAALFSRPLPPMSVAEQGAGA